MTVITDEHNIVVSVSFIPGLSSVPANWHVYFPAKCGANLPAEGTVYVETDWTWPLKQRPRWPLTNSDRQSIPMLPHAGAFGAIRKHDIHCGVDLYCSDGTAVVAMESGRVVAMEIFTGPDADPPSPWWHETCALYVEGPSGVIVYGEIEISPEISLTHKVNKGDFIGRVKQVLRNDKGLPMSMLHLELHCLGTRKTEIWELNGNPPASLLDPTEHLIRIE